jgi:alpha-1,3-rhamnosyl/mannosyltransferase
MLRVAYDVTVSARTVTGVGVYARELCAALRALPLDLREWQQPLVSKNRSHHRVTNGLRIARWLGIGVHQAMDREDIELYHSTTSIGPLRRRRPVVITLHDATHVTTRYSAAERAFHRIFRHEAAKRADAILTHSRAAAASIADVYGIPPERIRVAHLGVDARFRSVAPPTSSASEPAIGFSSPTSSI